MKTLLLTLFLAIPLLAYSQTPDTAAIRVEVDSLIELNSSLVKEQKLDEALLVIQLAEEKCLAAFGEETALYGLILSSIGIIYYYKGEYSNIEPFWLKAKNIREKVLGKEHPSYAWSLNNLAALYHQMGQYEKVEPLFVESKAIREKALGKEHPSYAGSLNNLAILYMDMGQYEKVEPLFVESKAIREKALGKEHPDYASSLNNLAILYMDMGQYEKAEPLYVESTAIREKALGKVHPDYASSLNNLAALYYKMGQYEKVEPMYVESTAIREKALGKEHPDYASSLGALATLYMDMGQYEKAEPMYLETKAIQENALGKEHPDYATSLNNLAVLYMNIGQFEKAEPLYLEAIAIREKALGKEHPLYAASLNNLATLYYNMGQYEKAEPLYVESKTIREKALGKEHPLYAASLNNLAALYLSMGRYEKAEPLYVEANEIERTLLRKACRHLSERELLIYTYKFIDEQNEFLSFAQTQSGLSKSAYDNSLFYKGFLLSATQQVNRLAQTDSTSTDMFYQLKGLNRRLASEYSKPLTERKGVAELEKKANTVEKELTRSVAGFGEALRQVNWQEVQQSLQPAVAAVEFVHFKFSKPEPTDSVLYAAIILKNSGTPQFIPLFEEKSLDSLFSHHQERRSDYVNDLYSLNDRGLRVDEKPVESLYELIWQPLEQALAGINTIYYAPSGLLHRINLNAIPVNDEKTFADIYHTVQLQSTRSLVIGNEGAANNNRAVLYGGIQYESDSMAIAAANVNYLEESLASRGSSNFDAIETSTRGGAWDFLKWTQKEVESIHSILEAGDFKTALLSDFEASEESFRALGRKEASPRILHIATHGFFFPDPENKPSKKDKEPVFKSSDHPMIRSGLILAGGNHVWQGHPPVGNMEDGILTAYEISQMNLSNTELVVLSACETGLGKIAGSEGVYGLQRAFRITGVKYLIMSLWQVPDKQTSMLMTTFYKKWLEDKMTIPDAFQAAQKQLRDFGFDPFQWAGFVLVE